MDNSGDPMQRSMLGSKNDFMKTKKARERAKMERAQNALKAKKTSYMNSQTPGSKHFLTGDEMKNEIQLGLVDRIMDAHEKGSVGTTSVIKEDATSAEGSMFAVPQAPKLSTFRLQENTFKNIIKLKGNAESRVQLNDNNLSPKGRNFNTHSTQ